MEINEEIASYYLDLDELMIACKLTDNEGESKDESINIFKYETLKMCIERVLHEFNDESDDDLSKFLPSNQQFSSSFFIAFNTLKNNKILKLTNGK